MSAKTKAKRQERLANRSTVQLALDHYREPRNPPLTVAEFRFRFNDLHDATAEDCERINQELVVCKDGMIRKR